MSEFTVEVRVHGENGSAETKDFKIDTGAHYTVIPRSILESLGVRPMAKRSVVFADGRRKVWDLGWVNLTLSEETLPTYVLFGDDGERLLLGALTLEAFSLGVDPVNKKLIPIESVEE